MIHRTRISKKERKNFLKEVHAIKLTAINRFWHNFNDSLYEKVLTAKSKQL